MTTAAVTTDGKTVFVREYLRLRHGKWEDVTSHFRKPPQRIALGR